MRLLPPGQGFLADGGRPVSPQNAFGGYYDATGRVPTYLFVGDSLSSQLPNSPTIDLVANGAALVNQAFPAAPNEGQPLDSPLMVAGYQYPNAVDVYHQILDTDVIDIDGSTPVAVTLCYRTTADAFPANTGSLMGKRELGGDVRGWDVILGSDGSMTVTWKGADLVQDSLGFDGYNIAAGQHGYADGRWHTADIEFDTGAGEIRFGNEHEDTMDAPWTTSSLSTATTFRLGSVRSLFAAGPFQAAFLAVSLGVQAMTGDPSGAAAALAEVTSLVEVVRHVNEDIS